MFERIDISPRIGSEIRMDRADFLAGTYARELGHKAFREDHWLHRTAGAAAFESERGRAIKAALRKQFYPDNDPWKEMVLARAFQVVRQTVQGLGES